LILILKLNINLKASFSLSSKDLIFALIFVLLTSVFGYVYRKNLCAQNEIDILRKKYDNMLHEKSLVHIKKKYVPIAANCFFGK
jgi:hypothetical protein